jgi:hypothetical protein
MVMKFMNWFGVDKGIVKLPVVKYIKIKTMYLST